MSAPVASVKTRARRPGRGTLLLSATLVASATTACPTLTGNGPFPGSVPTTTPPAADNACTEPQKVDAAVTKCCVRVTRPESQRMCTVEEQLQPNRCCPEP
jgi:hypothetical protein